MRTLQEIFNIVMGAKLYPVTPVHKQCMCGGLATARHAGLITEGEQSAAGTAIQDYMVELTHSDSYFSDSCYAYLVDNLAKMGLPHSDADMVAIYSNWEERPFV